jgi:hypothetical protein
VHTARVEGILSLWKGLTPMLCMEWPYSVVMFAVYGHFRPSARPSPPANCDNNEFLQAQYNTAYRRYLGGVFLVNIMLCTNNATRKQAHIKSSTTAGRRSIWHRCDSTTQPV